MIRSLKSILLVASAAAVLACASPALAAVVPNTVAPGVVNVAIAGNNGNVTINSITPYVNDTLNAQSTGAFSVNQTNRTDPTAQYSYNANTISRTAAFAGVGSVSAVSNWQSDTPYALGLSTLSATLSATAGGGVQQDLQFDQNNGGVFSIDQYKDQRTMQVSGAGVYNFAVTDTMASIAPSLASMPSGSLPASNFGVSASGTTGSANLLFSPTLGTTGYQALSTSNDHGKYTTLSTNFQLDSTDGSVVNVTGNAVIGATVNITQIPGTVTVPGTVAGTATIQ